MEQGQEKSNTALDAAKSESGSIMFDPNHPMHAAFVRGDETVKRHIDGLFERVVGKGKIELDGEIATTTSGADQSDPALTVQLLKEEFGETLPAKQDSFRNFAGEVPADLLDRVEGLIAADPAVMISVFRVSTFLDEQGYKIVKK